MMKLFRALPAVRRMIRWSLWALMQGESCFMAQTKHKEMDMLHGGLAGKLILFALPLAFSSILQQLFNSADVAVVGRFAGDTALAAVGSCVALVGAFLST